MKPFSIERKISSRISLLFACATATALLSSPSSAQVNTGLLIHSLPTLPQSKLKPDATAEDVEIGNPKAAITGVAAQYDSIRLTGFQSELADDVEGYRFVSQYFPLQLTSQDWERVSHDIFNNYTSRGKMVRVYLVMKEDKSAVVDISELRIHSIKLKNPGLRDEQVTDLNRLLREYVKEGEIIDLKKLKAFLSRIDYRGVETVTTKFLAITEDGVDLNITVEPRQIAEFDPWSVTMDNYGSAGFGPARVTASYSAPLFSPGDNLSVQTVISQGLQNISGRYDFPFPAVLPLRGSLWASGLQYETSDADVEERGHATLGGLDVNYPYFFWSGAKLVGGLGYERKQSKDEVVALDTTSKSISNLHIRFNASDFYDKRLSFSGDFVSGNLGLNGALATLQDNLTAQTRGSFQKFVWKADFVQPISTQSYLAASGNGQWADKNLDSLEKMYFGGSSGVRAYNNSVSGDEGALFSLNYLYQLPNMDSPTHVGGLIDYAIGKTSRSPWTGESTQSNTFHLNAIGVQADTTFQKLTFNTSLSHPIRSSAEVPDQSWQLWATLGFTF